jgi:hypothetical protein
MKSQEAQELGVKPHIILAGSTLIMIASGFAAYAQTAAPTTANPPGITQGPWTSPNSGNSKSQCKPGEYAVGIEVEGTPPGTKRCVGCVSRLRVICQRYGI